MSRFDVRPFTAESIPDAAELLAERHRRHRLAWPAFDPAYEDPRAVEPLIVDLFGRDQGAGTVVHASGGPAAYVLGTPRPDPSWGANVWVEDAGSAAREPEALRLAYASAAERWVADGKTQHYVVTPATDDPAVDAWFRLSFGLQSVHALREPTTADFKLAVPNDLVVRPATPSDTPALVEIDAVLPSHLRRSPVFSPISIPTADESRAEIHQDIDDRRFAPFVVEHQGRVVGKCDGLLDRALPRQHRHDATAQLRLPGLCGGAAQRAVPGRGARVG